MGGRDRLVSATIRSARLVPLPGSHPLVSPSKQDTRPSLRKGSRKRASAVGARIPTRERARLRHREVLCRNDADDFAPVNNGKGVVCRRIRPAAGSGVSEGITAMGSRVIALSRTLRSLLIASSGLRLGTSSNYLQDADADYTYAIVASIKAHRKRRSGQAP
jgi:hypothetical protein